MTELKETLKRECEVCGKYTVCSLHNDPWLAWMFDKKVLKWYCGDCWGALSEDVPDKYRV